MASPFPSNPSNGDTFDSYGRTYEYSSVKSAWHPVSRAPRLGELTDVDTTGISVGQDLTYDDVSGEYVPGYGSVSRVVATMNDLPVVKNNFGDLTFVQSNNRLYMWRGSAWTSVALVNTSPTITVGPDGAYTLAVDGTPTVITLEAQDPEGIPITWGYTVTSGSLEDTTVDIVGNEFTITPGNISTSFNLTFTASDTVNVATAVSSFSLFIVSFKQELTSTATGIHYFGRSTAIYGDYIVVGARYEDQGAIVDCGAAYVFYTADGGETWTQQARLIPGDPSANAYFGDSCAISGDTLVIGSSGKQAAYVFTRSGTTWTQRAKLTGSYTSSGWSCAMDGNTIVLGGSGGINIWTGSGTSWTSQGSFALAGSGGFYGISIHQDKLLVGAPTISGVGANAGGAYWFTRSGNTWTQRGYLIPSDSTAGWRFGGGVAVYGNYAVVGSHYKNPEGIGNTGGAYIFTTSNNGVSWTEQQILPIPALATDSNAQVGGEVAMYGDVAFIGNNYGKTSYVFVRDGSTWNLKAELNRNKMGGNVSIYNNYYAIGHEQLYAVSVYKS